MKRLIILRGVPGSGKSNLGELLSLIPGHIHIENDHYIYNKKGEYIWTYEKARIAADLCLEEVEKQMERETLSISVGNTFTKQGYINTYKKLAEKWGYQFISVVLENRHGGIDTKGCSEELLQGMEKRIIETLKLR